MRVGGACWAVVDAEGVVVLIVDTKGEADDALETLSHLYSMRSDSVRVVMLTLQPVARSDG